MHNTFCHVLQLETLTEDQLVSDVEKAELHAGWLAANPSKKRKKPAVSKDAVELDSVPIVTSA